MNRCDATNWAIVIVVVLLLVVVGSAAFAEWRRGERFTLDRTRDVVSDVDGQKYKVHLVHGDSDAAADTMAVLNSRVVELLRVLRAKYIRALEDEAFEMLPSETYVKGFLRSYAEYLGLDGEEIVRRYKSEATSSDSKQDLTFPTLVPEHGVPGGAIVILSTPARP